MELHLPIKINKFFWTLFPFIFILNSFHNIFNNWELYNFNEVEDFGTLLFVLGISACESALIIIFIWGTRNFFRRIFSKADN